MEAKTYNIQGQTFKLKPNTLELQKYGARLLARIRKLAYEYTKDADFSSVEKLNEEKNELETAKNQLQGLIDSNIDENGNELGEPKRTEYIFRINKYETCLKGIKNEFEKNLKLSKVVKLKSELEACAMMELISDSEFVKGTLGGLLEGGDINIIDFSKAEAGQMVSEVIYDFFCSAGGNGLK